MDKIGEFLDRLRADTQLYALVRNSIEELISEDPEVSDEELGWAAVDLATSTVDVPDDVDLDEVGERLREEAE